VRSPVASGLGDSHSCQGSESPSPDTPLREKSDRADSRSCLLPDCSPSSTVVTPRRPTRPTGLLTLPATRHKRGNGRARPPGSTARERADGAPRRRQVTRAARSDRDRSEAICSRQGATEAPGSPDRRATFRSEPHARQVRSPGTAGSSRPEQLSRAESEACPDRASTAHRAKRALRAERRSERASSPDRPASAPSRSHVLDQPAAGACPRPGRPSARPDRREGPPNTASGGQHGR
jgi:hypothetical protein